MIDIILKSLGFVLVILVAYCLKKVGMFTKEHGQFLAKLMMNVTMPCALLSAGANLHMNGVLLIALALGVLCNAALIVGGILIARKNGRFMQGIYAICTAGFNVGSFALPFVQYFFPAGLLGYVCMFDIGNAVMNLGVNNTVGGIVAATGARQTVKGVVKRLFSTPPFTVYLIVIALTIFGHSVPEELLTVVSIAGNANAFVAMTMIGLLLEIKLPKKDVKAVVKLLIGRYSLVAVMACLIWLLLPASADVKMVITLCIATPMTSIAPVFCQEMVGESDIPAAANSLSIVISLILMTTLMILF